MVLPSSFGRGCFQGNLFSFEIPKLLQKIFFDIRYLGNSPNYDLNKTKFEILANERYK